MEVDLYTNKYRCNVWWSKNRKQNC